MLYGSTLRFYLAIILSSWWHR